MKTARGGFPILSRATSLVASPWGMMVTVALSAWWAFDVGTLAGLLDAIISGGALLFGQALYRETEPRDIAMHRKLDEIIHGTDADDTLAGSEEKP